MKNIPLYLNWVLIGICGMWAGFPNDIIEMPLLVLLFPLALQRLGAQAPDGAHALRRGWLCSSIGALSIIYWIARPMVVVAGLPWALAVSWVSAMAVGLGSAGGIFAWTAFHLRHYPPVRYACMLGLIWYGLEYAYAAVGPFPWLPLAGALAAWPLLIQPAAVIGAYALGGCCATLIILLVTFRQRKSCAAAALLAAVLFIPSAWRLYTTPQDTTPQGPDTAAILFVEGNIDQSQKWDPAFQQQTVDTYLRLTQQGLAAMPGTHPLIVWPETAMPFYFQSHPLHSPRILEFAAAHNTPMLIGSPGHEPRPGTTSHAIFNRAFLISPQGQITDHYDKQYLVPFGEYTPSWLDFEILKPILQGVGTYSRGTRSAPLRSGDLALGMLICYEGIFPELAQKTVQEGANVLADLSNTGWFGDTAAPVQHQLLATLRAVEQNRWMLRGTNTGISSICDAQGRIVMAGGRNKAQAIAGRVRLVSEVSIFHILGWCIPLIALGLFILLAALPRAQRQPTL